MVFRLALVLLVRCPTTRSRTGKVCASVAVCEAVASVVVCRVFGRLLVCNSSWSVWMSSFHKRAVLGLLGSWCSGFASSLITAAFASWYALSNGLGMCVHVVLGLSYRSS